MPVVSSTDKQLKSLFLPAGGDNTSGKASAVLIGGHWPDHTCTSPPTSKTAKVSSPPPPHKEEGGAAAGGPRSLRLSDYTFHTSLLSAASTASHIVTVLRSGAVEIYNMTNGACGPYVQHTIPSPDKATAAKIGLSANGLHLEGFTKSKITCASLIPAEIALRQRLEEVGYLTPGPIATTEDTNQQMLSGNTIALSSGEVLGRRQAGVLATPDEEFDNHYYSPPESGREGAHSKTFPSVVGSPSEPFDNNISNRIDNKAARPPAVSGGPNTNSSSSKSVDDRMRLHSLFKDDEWRATVASLWRGVVGTSFGEVMVFDGQQYVLAFKCATNSPVVSVSCVLLPEDDSAIGAATHHQQQQQQRRSSTTQELNRNTRDAREGDGGNSSPVRTTHHIIDMSAFSSSPARASSVLNNVSMTTMGNGGSDGSAALNAGSAYFSVGFVTLQEDGGVMCWRRPRISGGMKVSPNPVVIHAASMFGKIKAIEVTHKFTIPMVLSNKTPHFPYGIETFIDEQRAVMGTRPSTGAGSIPASNTFANNPFWMNQLYLLQTQQQPLRTLDTFYEWQSPSGFAPEPLPLVSVVLVPESGLGGNVSARSVYGRRIDEDVMMDGKLKRTTAIQYDRSNNAIVAREKNLYSIDYTGREIRRLLGTSSPITHVAYSHPIAIVGCENGNIYVVNAHNGSVLAEYATYNGSRVRHLSFHYQSMIVTIVDDAGGEVEVLQLPTQFLRSGSFPSEKYATRQTAVLKFGIIASETGNNLVAKRTALDQRLMAQLSVPGCVQQYLSHNHILK